MKLPAGTDGGVITNPQEESAIRRLMSCYGAVEIDTELGHGLILTDHGKLTAAFFKDFSGSFRGREALDHLGNIRSDEAGYNQKFALRTYTEDEFRLATKICREEGMMLAETPAESGEDLSGNLDQARLQKILSLPGVIAISTFYEGFPVLSLGTADFEHVAALAEDLLRAGMKITSEMDIGHLDQLILETGTSKIVIAPCGDLFLCVFTREDAQLGLLRVAIKNIQTDLTRNA